MLYESARLRLECVDRVGTLWLDAPAGMVNVLSLAMLRDLDRALTVVHERPFIDVLLVRSARPDQFLIGPYVDELERQQNTSERYAFADLGQRVLARLEQLSENTTTVALIEGRCLNAGLELALACDFRLAVAKPETLVGIDALKCGWFPCWGATQRLVRAVGPELALDLLTSGRLLPARAAKQIGLVNHAFGPRPAKTELWAFLADLQDNPRARRRLRRSWGRRLRESRLLSGRTVFQPRDRRLATVAERGLLATVERGWRFGETAGFAAERAAFVALADDTELREHRAHTRQRERLLASTAAVPRPIRIGIACVNRESIELALLALRFGGSVCLADTNSDARTTAARQLERGLQESVTTGWLNVVEAAQKQKSIVITSDLGALACSEIAFVTGPADAQRRAIVELDHRLPRTTTIVATASLSASFAHQLDHPERLVAARLPDAPLDGGTVELIPLAQTTEPALARLVRWFHWCGKHVDCAQPVAAPEAVFAA